MNVMDEIRRRLAVLGPTRFELIDDSALHAGHAVEHDELEVWETIAPPKARRPEPPSPTPPAPGIAI